MPRIKLDESKALTWGCYSYMLGGLHKNSEGIDTVSFRHLAHSMSGQTKKEALAWTKEYNTTVWAWLPYFSVPMSTAEVGELRNKGFIGYALASKYVAFEKPLRLFDAIRTIEQGRMPQVAEATAQ